VQECLEFGGTVYYIKEPLRSRDFALGVHYLPGYAILRETYIIFNYSAKYDECGLGVPGDRLEQVLRGPDGRIYLNRPWYEPNSPDTDWPVLLEDRIADGYTLYQLSDFQN
jgi:hypothetical protein